MPGSGHQVRGPRRCRSNEGGASAVEFALIMPVLFLVLFGIVDYGFWFNDSLNVRQGVREGARQGVVKNFDPDCSGSNTAKIACQTEEAIGAVTGDTYVKVVVPPAGWKRGEPLLVCAMVKSDALTGFVPLPADGVIKSKTHMSIEAASPVEAETTYEEAAPTGSDWTWCS